MNAALQLTPQGRVPDTPLANPRHEVVAHETVLGRDCRTCGLAAGYKDGPGLKGNIARLRQTPAMRERIAEISARSAELAEVHAGWVLGDMKLFAGASLARFWKRDEQGRLAMVESGKHRVPTLDFSQATEDDIRTLGKLKFTKFGPEIELRDAPQATQKLGEYLGLWKNGASAAASALSVTIVRFSEQENAA